MHHSGVDQRSIAPLVVLHQVHLELLAILSETGNQIGLLRGTATQVHGHVTLLIGITSVLVQMAGKNRRHSIFVNHVVEAFLLRLGSHVVQRFMHVDDDGVARRSRQPEIRLEPIQRIVDFERRRVQWMSNPGGIGRFVVELNHMHFADIFRIGETARIGLAQKATGNLQIEVIDLTFMMLFELDDTSCRTAIAKAIIDIVFIVVITKPVEIFALEMFIQQILHERALPAMPECGYITIDHQGNLRLRAVQISEFGNARKLGFHQPFRALLEFGIGFGDAAIGLVRPRILSIRSKHHVFRHVSSGLSGNSRS